MSEKLPKQLKRKRDSEINQSNTEFVAGSPKKCVTHSMIFDFEQTLFIICQEHKKEPLHKATTLSRDEKIKRAFDIVSRLLALFKIRFNAAMDASQVFNYAYYIWIMFLETNKLSSSICFFVRI